MDSRCKVKGSFPPLLRAILPGCNQRGLTWILGGGSQTGPLKMQEAFTHLFLPFPLLAASWSQFCSKNRSTDLSTRSSLPFQCFSLSLVTFYQVRRQRWREAHLCSYAHVWTVTALLSPTLSLSFSLTLFYQCCCPSVVFNKSVSTVEWRLRFYYHVVTFQHIFFCKQPLKRDSVFALCVFLCVCMFQRLLSVPLVSL